MSALTIPCRNGPSCRHLKKTTCRFFHPEDHYPGCSICKKKGLFINGRCPPCIDKIYDTVHTIACMVCSFKCVYTLQTYHTYGIPINNGLCKDCEPIRRLLRTAFNGNDINLGCNEYNDLVFEITYKVEGSEWEGEESEKHAIIMPILTCFKEADLFDTGVDLVKKYCKEFTELYTFPGPYSGHPTISAWLYNCSVQSVRVISRWSLYVPGYPVESAYQRRRFLLSGD